MVIHKLSTPLRMPNPIKTWFFELIEDAIGSKAMEQFKKEEKEEDKNNPETNNESEND